MKPVVDEGRWLATEPATTAAELAARFRGGMKRGIVFLVLEDEEDVGSVVGSVGLHPGEGDGVWGLGMWLATELRGRGLGRRMLEAALEITWHEGAGKVEIEVFADNQPALALYGGAGFAVEDVLADCYRRGDGTVKSSVVMGLRRPSAA